jgi:V/A-type H+-transporting ATPase subunit F
MESDPEGGIVVVGDKTTVMMYKTIGCIGVEVSNPNQLLEAVDAYARRADVSLILVVQDISLPVREEIEKIMRVTGKIVSYIPSIFTQGEAVDMQKLLMKALGFG